MILEFFIGAFVSALVIISFLSIRYIDSINKWILVTSKFVYYSGHPLWDDEQIFEEITKRFKTVFTSLTIVIFKTILFLFFILVLVALSSLFIYMIRNNSLPQFNSLELASILFPRYLVQFPFLIGTIIPMIIAPLFFKNKKNINATYSPIEKFLHYIFLGNKNIAKFLFKLELWFNKKHIKALYTSQNIYISGMARAGTTVLMQYLGQLPEFKSLSYKNLPFLFLPKTGSRLISNKKFKERERSHQDGIKHSINSYEALEEPFWRNYIGEKYIHDKTILKHTISQELFEKYNSFRKLVAGEKIYLAKNNNHLLRAEVLHQLDKAKVNKTITIIPFRDPYDQANSLLKQHLLLSKMQEEDDFVLDYMDFLVHHEFGLHTKTPNLSNNNTISILYDINSIQYWLEIWYLYYLEVLKQFSNKEGFYFFCYENFRDHPKQSLEKLLSVIDLPESLINKIFIKEFKVKNNVQSVYADVKYLELYNKLKLTAINKNDG